MYLGVPGKLPLDGITPAAEYPTSRFVCKKGSMTVSNSGLGARFVMVRKIYENPNCVGAVDSAPWPCVGTDASAAVGHGGNVGGQNCVLFDGSVATEVSCEVLMLVPNACDEAIGILFAAAGSAVPADVDASQKASVYCAATCYGCSQVRLALPPPSPPPPLPSPPPPSPSPPPSAPKPPPSPPASPPPPRAPIPDNCIQIKDVDSSGPIMEDWRHPVLGSMSSAVLGDLHDGGPHCGRLLRGLLGRRPGHSHDDGPIHLRKRRHDGV